MEQELQTRRRNFKILVYMDGRKGVAKTMGRKPIGLTVQANLTTPAKQLTVSYEKLNLDQSFHWIN